MAYRSARGTIYRLRSVHVVIVPRGPLSELAKSFRSAAEQTRPNFFIVLTSEQAYECLRQQHSRASGKQNRLAGPATAHLVLPCSKAVETE